MNLSRDWMSLMVWVVACQFCFQAHGREFTDVQGRKLTGELESVSGGQAVIRRSADARAFTVAISQFSPEDQKFMTDFAASHSHYEFEVKLAKVKKGTSKTKEDNVNYTSEQWAYKAEVTNRSSSDAADLHVDYWLFAKVDDGKVKTGARVQQAGSEKIGQLRRSVAHQFQTKTMTLTKRELDAGFHYLDGAKNQAGDSTGGVAMRFFVGDKEVFAWASDPELLKSAKGPVKSASDSESSQ